MTLCEMGLDHAAYWLPTRIPESFGDRQTSMHVGCKSLGTFRGWNLSREVTSVLCSDEVKALASLALWHGEEDPGLTASPRLRATLQEGPWSKGLLPRPSFGTAWSLGITTLKKPCTNDPFPKPWALLAETLESQIPLAVLRGCWVDQQAGILC